MAWLDDIPRSAWGKNHAFSCVLQAAEKLDQVCEFDVLAALGIALGLQLLHSNVGAMDTGEEYAMLKEAPAARSISQRYS